MQSIFVLAITIGNKKNLQLLYQFILCILLGLFYIYILSYGTFPSIKIGFSLDILGFSKS